jgi:hypothetical protein
VTETHRDVLQKPGGREQNPVRSQDTRDDGQVKNQFKVVRDLRDTRTDESAQYTIGAPLGARVVFKEVNWCLAS